MYISKLPKTELILTHINFVLQADVNALWEDFGHYESLNCNLCQNTTAMIDQYSAEELEADFIFHFTQQEQIKLANG